MVLILILGLLALLGLAYQQRSYEIVSFCTEEVGTEQRTEQEPRIEAFTRETRYTWSGSRLPGL